MRIITLEEHFAAPRFFEGPGRDMKEQAEKFNNARALKLIPPAISAKGFPACSSASTSWRPRSPG